MGKLFLWSTGILIIICKLNLEFFPMVGSSINQFLIVCSSVFLIGLWLAIGYEKDKEGEKKN